MTQNDLAIASRLAATHDLDHLVLDVAEELPASVGFREAWRRSEGPRGINEDLAWTYWKRLGGRYVHVGSNIVEVTRTFYMKHLDAAEQAASTDFDAAMLARLYHRKAPERFVAQFQEFIDVTGFCAEAMRGYHFADLFYWEHRMGIWMGEALRMGRVDHLTWIPYNCRRILEAMIARPLRERFRADVVYALITALWPELLQTPVFSGLAPVRRRDVAAPETNSVSREM